MHRHNQNADREISLGLAEILASFNRQGHHHHSRNDGAPGDEEGSNDGALVELGGGNEENQEYLEKVPSYDSVELVETLVDRIGRVMAMLRSAVENLKKVAQEQYTASFSPRESAHVVMLPQATLTPEAGTHCTSSSIYSQDGSLNESSEKTATVAGRAPETDTAVKDELTIAHEKLCRIRDLLFFLWTRLCRLLSDESDLCADSYARTLDVQKRIPAFEALTRIIYERKAFCEALGELIETVYEDRPMLDDEALVAPHPVHSGVSTPSRQSGESLESHTTGALSEACNAGHRNAEDRLAEGNEQEKSRQAIQSCLHDMLVKHFRWMLKLQRVASVCGVLIIEGTRESFMEPTSMTELCKRIMTEKVRQKRLIPLCLAFCMLDQDVSATGEAMIQGVPGQLLQWFRHLSHRLFTPRTPSSASPGRVLFSSQPSGPWLEGQLVPYEAHGLAGSPSRPVSAIRPSRERRGASPSLTDAFRLHLGGLVSPLATPLPSPTLSPVPQSRTPAPKVFFPVQMPPSTSTAGADETTVDEAPSPLPFPRGAQEPEPLETSSRSRTLLTEWRERVDAQCRVDLSRWRPTVGQLVGRGPGWRFGEQGKGADYGVVVHVLPEREEVLVMWVPSEDASKAARRHLTQPSRVFRYRYTYPFYEVVDWGDYLKVKTMTVDKDMMLFLDFVWICAVVGVLCQQVESVQSALKFETIPSLITAINSVDLASSHHRAEITTEEAEAAAWAQVEQMRRELGEYVHVMEGVSREKWVELLLPWQGEYVASKFQFRLDRECVTRAGWSLNALLSHKKLALLFLAHDGLRSIIQISSGPLEVSTTYGCAILFSRLAKSTIFEEVLRRHDQYFEPILSFCLHLWLTSSHADVQTSAGAFMFHSLSFPCVVEYFDRLDGPSKTLAMLDKALKNSIEQVDVLQPNLQLVALRCLNTYLVSHLMLSTSVIFRKHRELTCLARNVSAVVSLPRDPLRVEEILGHLSSTNPTLPDVTLDNIRSRLTFECLRTIPPLLQQGFLYVILNSLRFYFIQSRWELLIASLQTLHILTVIPQIRPLFLEQRGEERSGLARLVMVLSELSDSFQKAGHNSSKESHLIPCLVTALHVMIHLMSLPNSEVGPEDASGAMTFFNSTCTLFRASDGVRTLLSILQMRKDASFSAKTKYFPVVARAVQLMAMLRKFADTSQLFEALGVHDVAFSIGQVYLPVQQKLTVEGSFTEHDPANHFMNHLKVLKERPFTFSSDPRSPSTLPFAAGGWGLSGRSGTNPSERVLANAAASTEAMEMDQRQAIAARAVIEYKKDSLLELMARHLESEGLKEVAVHLRRDAGLPVEGGEGNSTNSSSTLPSLSLIHPNPPAELPLEAPPKPPAPSLHDIIQVYLRQLQERCMGTDPIEALPQFDLTTSHVYQPIPMPVHSTRGVMNRRLHRKLGRPYTKQMCVYDSCFTYGNPCFLFDITGVGEGLLGESICFVDNGNALAIGSSEGGLTLFDTYVKSSDDKVIEQHMVFDNEGINSLGASPDGDLIVAIREDSHAVIMRRSFLPAPVVEIDGCEAIRISHDNVWGLCTMETKNCELYDLNSQEVVRKFSDPALITPTNERNVAIFDPTSQLVLHDAVLWDVRCPGTTPIFRFDRFSESFATAFHPYLPQVIIDERVWDLRCSGIVQTVPIFQHASSFHTSRVGRVLYSFRGRSDTFGSMVSAVDTIRYEMIFSLEVQPTFKAFTLDPSDRYCAAILEDEAEAVIRVFSTSAIGFEHAPFASPNLLDASEADSDLPQSDLDDESEWSVGSSEVESSGLDYSGDEDDEDGSSYTLDTGGPSSRGGEASLRRAAHSLSASHTEESTELSDGSETSESHSGEVDEEEADYSVASSEEFEEVEEEDEFREAELSDEEERSDPEGDPPGATGSSQRPTPHPRQSYKRRRSHGELVLSDKET